MPPRASLCPDGPPSTRSRRPSKCARPRAAEAGSRATAFHRLNRAEYGNAVRDLLALDIDSTAILPADDSSLRVRQHRGRPQDFPSLLER